jgi:2-oxoglutarate ferredoxin oxidoreductase subunit gamma
MAKAAVEQDGLYAAQTQSYGAQTRGGDATADVIVSQEQIDYPHAQTLDVLVALSQSALDKNIDRLSPDGTLIIDSDLVTQLPKRKAGLLYRIPATSCASGKLGKRVVANMIMLGATAKLTGIVTIDGLLRALEESVPSNLLDVNARAIQEGVNIASAVNH